MRTVPLPPFDANGLLPRGEYQLTIEELRASMLVTGIPGGGETWASGWRFRLVERLSIRVRQLFDAGISVIYVDGSFATNKPRPGDIDVCFRCDPAQIPSLGRELVGRDRLWVGSFDGGASHTVDPFSGKLKSPMWHTDRLEVFTDFGQPSGIRDAQGRDLPFHLAFQQTEDHRPKGIVRIVP